MTILVTADVHLSANPRDAYRHEFMRKLPALAKKHKTELILILGDFTEEKDAHTAELVNSVVDHFQALSQIAPVIALQGNHDWLSSPDNPYFAFLRHIDGVSWVGRPTPLSRLSNVPATVSKALGPAILLPHTPNPDREWEDIDFDGYDWAFCHQTFAGTSSDSGYKLSGVSLSLFPKQLKVVSGDIHTPQTLGNVTYVGSPFRIDYGDEFQPRILLIESGKMRSLPVGGSQKRLIEVKSLAELKQDKVQLAGPNDILKVRLEICPNQHAEWPSLVAEVKAWGAKNGYIIDTVQPIVVGGQKSMMKERKNHTTQTDEQLLAEYAAARSVDEKTVKTGLGLL